MSDYPIGYGKPPQASQFKAGKSGNPKGRPKRRNRSLADVIDNALGAPITYREQGRAKLVSREEFALKALIGFAIKGDIGAADHILKLYAHARRFGDADVNQIRIENWLPDHGEQTARRKATADAQSEVTPDPSEWWNDPKQK